MPFHPKLQHKFELQIAYFEGGEGGGVTSWPNVSCRLIGEGVVGGKGETGFMSEGAVS